MSSCAVLVVDDEAAMRTALEASFRRNGWSVTTASGASEALAKFRLSPCPLVVTDVRMPDGGGLQVMQGVREIAPETAVIFLTAYGTVNEAVQAIKDGACDYLMKPVSFDKLRETAERVLSMARISTKAKLPNAGGGKACRRIAGIRRPSGKGAASGAHWRGCIDRSGKRHGQGTGCAAHPPGELQARRAVRGHELLGVSRNICSKANCSATFAARLPEPAMPSRENLSWPMAAQFCSTKSERCRWNFSRNCCACCRKGKSIHWAAREPFRSMCA